MSQALDYTTRPARGGAAGRLMFLFAGAISLLLAWDNPAALARGWPAVNSDIPQGRAAIRALGYVKTNTELKAANGAAFPDGVYRLGFAQPGDGGGAPYYWSGTNCPHPDNGAQVQPTTTGCWMGELQSPVAVAVWGANAAAADNTTAFNNADLWASRVGGATITLSGATYIVSCGTTPWVRHSNTFFKGVGENTSIVKLCNGSSTDLMQTVNVTTAVPRSASSTSIIVPPPSFSVPLNVVFTVSSGLSFTTGERVQAVVSTDPDRSIFITGHVIDYTDTSLTMSVERGSDGISGNTYAAWDITQVGNTLDIKAGDGEVNGPAIWGLEDIQLDGNAANNTSNPNGRCIYSYSKGARIRGNVTITNCWGIGWEEHGPPGLPTFPNDNGIHYISNLYLVRANQRNVPDYPGGIGGGGFFVNGPPDYRMDNLVLGWITGGYQLKTGRWGPGRYGNVEFGGGGWSDGNLYLAENAYINECDTGDCFTASQLIFSNAAYKRNILVRTSGFHATGGYSYTSVTVSSQTTQTIPTSFPTAMSFIVPARYGFTPGQTVYIRPTSDAQKGISGTVVSYDFDSGGLNITATAAVGTGIYNSWSVGPGIYQTFIQVGDAANGYSPTDIDLDTYCQDCNYNNAIRFDSSGGFNRIRLRIYDNYEDQPNAGNSGTYNTDSDHFSVHIDRGGSAFTTGFVGPLDINYKPSNQFMPTMFGSTSGTGTLNEAGTFGIYNQNGSDVSINARVEWTAHNIVDEVRIGGFPVPALNNGNYNGSCAIIGMSGVSFNGPSQTWMNGIVQFTRNYTFFVQHGSGQTDTTLTGLNIDQAGYIDFECHYSQ